MLHQHNPAALAGPDPGEIVTIPSGAM